MIRARGAIVAILCLVVAAIALALPSVRAGADSFQQSFLRGYAGELDANPGGSVTLNIPTGAANTVVKATPGRLVRLTVTTVGSTALTCYDNATTNAGTVLGGINATNAAVLFYTVEFDAPAALGITCANTASGPIVTAQRF